MNKNFFTINSLLQTEGLEESEGRIILSEEQVQVINARLTEAEGLDTQVQTLTAERDSVRAELQNAITAIDGISDEIAGAETFEGKINAIRTLLDKAAGTTTHAQLEGDGHEAAVASDPINQVASAYIRK